MKYEFGLCGPFDFEEKTTGGQSVKTREFYFGLCDAVGKQNIQILESTSYKRNPLSFLLNMMKLMKECKNVVIFPAQNGIRVFAPLCRILKSFFGTNTYYSVIGGWLANIIDNNPGLKKSLNSFNCILVETNIMKQELKERGIINSVKLANFKRLEPIQEEKIKEVGSPIRLCYFSRVTKRKGISDAVQVVNRINKNGLKCLFDIYGPVADRFDSEFELLRQEFGRGINYKGKVDPSESVETISKYDIQLFPTRYETEGIPGSILDSYFAGVPVVAAKWNSYEDLVVEDQTGIGYEIGNQDDFYIKLSGLIENKEKIMHMKRCALQEANRYMPKAVISEFLHMVRS